MHLEELRWTKSPKSVMTTMAKCVLSVTTTETMPMHETKLGSSSNETNQQKVRSSLVSTGRSLLKLDRSLDVAIDTSAFFNRYKAVPLSTVKRIFDILNYCLVFCGKFKVEPESDPPVMT
jgi:hypothetical protein